MKLWTAQTVEAYNKIVETGVLHTNPDFIDPAFKNAYDWLVGEMTKRIGAAPEGVKYPIWAWHTYNGKHQSPDLEHFASYFKKGEKGIILELDIPDEQVVLSEYHLWHDVLNSSYIDNSHNEEEWEKEQTWYSNLSLSKQAKVKKKSWQKVFNVKKYDSEWIKIGFFVQATFWELRKEQIKNVQIIK